MYNPLLEDPSKIKDADLENKILDLQKKYHIAANLGHGSVCEHIVSILEVYKSERQKRHFEATQKLLKNQSKDLDDLINVD